MTNSMKISEELLAMLRCPSSGQKLRFAGNEMTQLVNEAIASGVARDRLEHKVMEPIEDGLVTEKEDWIYPIRSDIPTLVSEEAINLGSLKQKDE